MKYLFAAACLFFSLAAAAHPGVGIAMDSRKNVFYTDLKHVWKIDSMGKKSVAVANVHTHELYIDANDNLFGEHLWYEGEATDKWGHYVWKLSADGTLHKVIPETEGFVKDYSFVRDHRGRMYWADRSTDCQQIIKKDPGQKPSVLSGGCFTNVRWMVSSAAGDVYLMDHFDLKRVHRDGKVTTIARGLQENNASVFTWFQPRDPHLVMGIALDKDENIYAAVAGGRQIKRITKSGEVTIAAEVRLPWAPSGVMISDDGDLWILEYTVADVFGARVERIMKNGKRLVY